jgi:hypothetical protein
MLPLITRGPEKLFCGIQDTRQIIFGKTISAQNNNEKSGLKAQLRQNYTSSNKMHNTKTESNIIRY